MAERVLVLGAGGQLARLLRPALEAVPGLRFGFQSRAAAHSSDGLAFDLLGEAEALGMAAREYGAVVSLAGVTAGGDLELNTPLALAALEVARVAGAARVLIASSGAVYGPGAGHAEGDALRPVSEYGRAKLRMEQVVARCVVAAGAEAPAATLLRIGNVAGADSLLGGAPGTVQLDRFADGSSPRRSYIGPVTLAGVLAGLVCAPTLPPILNLAAPGAVAMAALLRSAGREWHDVSAPPGAVPLVELDTRRLWSLVPLPPGSTDPARMVMEWRGLMAEAAPCR